MAIDDDPLLIKAKYVAEDVSSENENVAQAACNVIASAMLPLHIGDAITGILGAVSQRRWNERVAELLRDFAERVSKISESIPDPNYFQSEEFQALLIEAIDQQRTNYIVLKRRMLAVGLANSGSKAFIKEQDKEVFFESCET